MHLAHAKAFVAISARPLTRKSPDQTFLIRHLLAVLSRISIGPHFLLRLATCGGDSIKLLRVSSVRL